MPEAAASPRAIVLRVLPPYAVTGIGYFGYSMLGTLFVPMLLAPDSGFLPPAASTEERSLVLVIGGLLAIYPLAQFVGSPVLGALSDRYGRKPVLLDHARLFHARHCSSGQQPRHHAAARVLDRIGRRRVHGAHRGGAIALDRAAADMASLSSH